MTIFSCVLDSHKLPISKLLSLPHGRGGKWGNVTISVILDIVHLVQCGAKSDIVHQRRKNYQKQSFIKSTEGWPSQSEKSHASNNEWKPSYQPRDTFPVTRWAMTIVTLRHFLLNIHNSGHYLVEKSWLKPRKKFDKKISEFLRDCWLIIWYTFFFL